MAPTTSAPICPAAVDVEVLHRRLAQQGEHICLDSHLLNSNNLLNEVAYQVSELSSVQQSVQGLAGD